MFKEKKNIWESTLQTFDISEDFTCMNDILSRTKIPCNAGYCNINVKIWMTSTRWRGMIVRDGVLTDITEEVSMVIWFWEVHGKRLNHLIIISNKIDFLTCYSFSMRQMFKQVFFRSYWVKDLIGKILIKYRQKWYQTSNSLYGYT